MTSMSSRFFHARPWLVGALIAAALSPLQAESTRRVRIEFAGDCIGIGDTIKIVLQGNETLQFIATRKHPSDTFWTGEWPHPDRTKSFNAADEFASLRLAGARTDCRASYPIEEPDGRWVAAFTFNCDEQTVRQIAVRTLPPIPVAFVREVPKFDDEPMSRDCSEYGRFRKGFGTIADVDLDSESVRLQAGWASPQPDSPGLFIDHPAVLKRVNGAGQVQLTLDTFLDALTEQRARGKLSPPLLSGPARDAEKERLAQLELKQIELKGLQRKGR
jgi:hypothetical protein